MVITVNIYYQGINGNAKKFAEEMISSGIVNEIRSENGNIRYDYFFPMDDNETVLLIDSWNDQHALDIHHASSMMKNSHLSSCSFPETDQYAKVGTISTH